MNEPHSSSSTDPTVTSARAESMFTSDAATEVPEPALPSRRIAIGEVIGGRYTLVDRIGEGGMGSVYRAHQTEPVKRDVALKLIKSGMDSRNVLARFNAERQALALMDHPSIARVFDGGTTPDGQPFFVMELVNGPTITQYCDSHRLSTNARLELFVAVCQAVQHAHQKGIIHRDLKPSNILVTEVDGRPTPKVIDFGVAKATERNLFDQSIAETGAIIGTPAYMSPEQADPTNSDIDTRSDVYSLGVVLYELLTGTPPLEPAQFKRGAVLEMLRMVREVDPPRPSTKISVTEHLPNIAVNRSTEPAKLAKLLRGELDWVVMKSLEKDRARRYDSANGLARDIQRYLADEVVEARPPSRSYRARKFIRRNKVQVLAASLVILALIGGMIGTSVGLVQARQARDAEAKQREVAEKNEKLAQEEQAKAVAARKDAEKARDVSTEQRKLALDTVRGVLLRVDELMKNDVRLAPLRIEIIRRMLDDVDRIRDHAIKNPLEDRTEAIAYARMGEVYSRSNRPTDAQDWLIKCYNLLSSLSANAPDDLNAMRNLSSICMSLGAVEWQLGRGPRARDLYEESLAVRRKRRALLKKDADEVEVMSADMEIAESLHALAYADLRMGEPERSLRLFQEAEKAYRDLPVPLGGTIRVKRTLSEIEVRIADAYARLNRVAEAEKQYRLVLTNREELGRADVRPKQLASLVRTDVGQSRMYLGDFHLMIQRDKAAARAEYEACLALFEELHKDEPDNLDLHQRLGATYYRLALSEADPTKAKAWFEKSLVWREKLARIDAGNMESQVEYLLVLARLGRFEDTDRLAQRVLKQAGADPQSLFQTACGYAICSQGKHPNADEYRKKTFEVLKRLLESGWKDAVGIRTDPDFEFIRNDPRFLEVIRKK